MVWPSGMGGAANGGAGNVRGGVGTGETAEISLTALSAMKLWSAMSLPKRSNASPAGGGGGGGAARGSGGRSSGSGDGIGARDMSGGGGGGVSAGGGVAGSEGSPAPVSTAPGGGVVVTST